MILATDDRSVLGDLITPPEGFSFDEGIITTYTLDLLSLLIVPLHFTLEPTSDADGNPSLDPIALLSALQQNAERLSVYCQAGGISVPSNQERLFSYLEGSVIQAVSPRGGAFHPKVWLFRYSSTDEVRYRLAVFSRNLTMDRSWDTALLLAGTVADRQVGYSKTRPVADFIAALPGMASPAAGPVAIARAQRMADEVRKVKFELPEGFDQVEYLPMGLDTRRRSPPSFAVKRGLVVSPFVSSRELERIADECADTVLISRAESLDAIEPSVLSRFAAVKVLADAVESEQQAEASLDANALTGLHAKIHVLEHGRRVTVSTGSANATWASHAANVEFMVDLEGPRRSARIDDFLKLEQGVNNLGSMLRDYRSPSDGPVPASVEQRLDRVLDEASTSLAQMLSGLTAVAAGDDIWRLTVTAKAHDYSLPAEVMSAHCRPLALAEGSSRAMELTTLDAVAVFPTVSSSSLSSFLVVELLADLEGMTRRKEFVLNLPLEGGPEDRQSLVVRDILRDRSAVMRLLLLLLGDTQSLLYGDAASTDLIPDSRIDGSSAHAMALLEPMLRTLHRDPDRLTKVEKVLAHLAGDEFKDRLPEGWDEVWPAIKAARQALHS